MEAHVRAGIEVQGTVLRYAEVEQYGPRYRLLRLGRCDFDFDVVGELVQVPASPHRQTVAEALADVYAGTVATSLHVALHPLHATSFFSPMPRSTPEDDRLARLKAESALLLGDETAASVRLTADPVGLETLEDGRQVAWVHGLAVPVRLHEPFDQVLAVSPFLQYRFRLSMQAAAAVMGRLHAPPHNGRVTYALALGWYESHVEYVLTRQGDWYFSHHTTVASPSDAAYFALALCHRLGVTPADVDRLYVYGQPVDLAALQPLEMIFRTSPARLNALYAVDLDPGSLDADFDAEAYVPCIGAAL